MTAAACRAGLRLGSGLGFEEGDLIPETEDENAVSGMNAALCGRRHAGETQPPTATR